MLKRYAACKDEEEVKGCEKRWLEKIEKEWKDSRDGGVGGDADAWAGGNMNMREMMDSDDEDEESGDGAEDDEEAGAAGGVTIPNIPVSEDDDEEEMAELRRRVLASKPFSNPSITTEKAQPERTSRAPPVTDDSEAESDVSGIGDDDTAFDNIIDATPVTDRTGIQAKQRLKGNTVAFSRMEVGAPRKR